MDMDHSNPGEADMRYPGMHYALSLPEILGHILECCEVSDLKNCRLVSKYWRDCAKKVWRDSATIRLSTRDPHVDTKIASFLQRKQGLEIYGNISLSLYIHPDNLPLFWSFLDITGANLRVLELRDCTFPDAALLRDVLFRSFPNMVQLSYINNKVEPTIAAQHIVYRSREIRNHKNMTRLVIDGSLNESGVTWIELFTNFSKLKALQIQLHANHPTVRKILDAVEIVREHDPNNLPLTTMLTDERIVGENDISFERVLMDKNIQLQQLSLCLNGDNCATLLQKIIRKHGISLRKLVLLRKSRPLLELEQCFPQDISVQLLANLQELRLCPRVFTTLAFLKFTPNLKRLSFARFQEYDPSLIIETAKLPDMKDFKLSNCLELEMENFPTVKRLQLIMKWLPNIERLKMPLENATFEQVCRGWPNLISIIITSNKVDECGLTGLDSYQVKIINDALGKLVWRPDTVPRANIASLKYLQNFSISNDFMEMKDLSHCSIEYGFQQMTSLETVIIETVSKTSGLWTSVPSSKASAASKGEIYTWEPLLANALLKRSKWANNLPKKKRTRCNEEMMVEAQENQQNDGRPPA